LLKLNDILAILHETGHALHNLLSQTQYGLLHGTGVCRDFVEIPSTVVEKIMTRPRVLQDISCHYAYISLEYTESWIKDQKNLDDAKAIALPEKKIPEALITRMLQKFRESATFMNNANIAGSLFDMAVHHPTNHLDLENMNLASEFNRIHKDIRLLDGLEELGHGMDYGHKFAHFQHLIGDSAAQYYAYVRCGNLSKCFN
jgi:metallopeptidase MepB